MQSYFVEIAAVQLAAALLEEESVKRFPQYAYAGALERFDTLQAFGIRQTEGIDDMKAKAAAFRFGQRCARIMRIERIDTGISSQRAVMNGMFFSEPDVNIDPPMLRQLMRAFLRRAQLQTHTA